MSGFKLINIAAKKPPLQSAAAVTFKPSKITRLIDDDDSGDDDGDGDGDGNGSKGRKNGGAEAHDARQRIARVNKLLVEQRQKAEKEAMKCKHTLDPSIYDFDGLNDRQTKESDGGKQTDASVLSSISTSVGGRPIGGPPEQLSEPPKSRYMDDLMQAAKRRERENDRAIERRLLREKEKEERENPDIPEQAFITSAYKEKLKEREMWEAEEKRQHELEKIEDVRKIGMTAFYSNTEKNISMGADVETSSISAYTSGGKRIQSLIAPSSSSSSSSSFSSSNSSSSLSATLLTSSIGCKRESEHIPDEFNKKNSSYISDSGSSASNNASCDAIYSNNADRNSSNSEGSATATAANANTNANSDSNAFDATATVIVSKEEKIMSAKERYLARKQQKLDTDTTGYS